MSKIKYVELPYVKKPVSGIIFGTAMSPFTSGGDGMSLLDDIYALGVNAFDTARAYGGAEASLGRWIESRGLRDQVVILSKCGHPDSSWNKRVNREQMYADLKQSLKDLRTDYIDMYILHRDDTDMPAGEITEIFNEMHHKGYIGAFGGSNWHHTRIEQANEYAYKHGLVPFTVSSPNFGVAEQLCDVWGGGCVTISGPQYQDAREWYRKQQTAVVAYSSLARGLFSGKIKSSDYDRIDQLVDKITMRGYVSVENFERLRRCEELAEKKGCSVAQIAMAWIYAQGLNAFAVVSTSSAKRMQENIDALQIPLTQEETAYIALEI